MKSWHRLHKGDIVDIVAPGSRVADATVEAGCEALREWGLVPRIGPPSLFAKDLLEAGSVEHRVAHLKRALLAPDSAAVWCVRGGYGSLRLIPELLKLKRPHEAKLFIGLSDISSLHLFLNQKWGWSTLHAPLLDRLGLKKIKPRYERELRSVVFGKETKIEFPKLKPMNAAARKKVKIDGTVSGGNLIVMGGHLGTKLEWKTEGHIIFLEELAERGYRIDRVLTQMTQSGVFDACGAVVFGDMIGGEEPDGSSLVWPVIERFAEAMKVPVLRGLESGHDIIQRPVPFNTEARLVLGGKHGKLICEIGSTK